MHILILILKIIGILLLTILGLLILVFGLVVFVPVKYKIEAVFPECEQEEKTDYRIVAKLRWLLGIVSYTMRYPDEGNSVLRIFGIPIRKRKKVSKEKKSSARVDTTIDTVTDAESDTAIDVNADTVDYTESMTDSTHKTESDKSNNKSVKKSKKSKRSKKKRFRGVYDIRGNFNNIKPIFFGNENKAARLFIKEVIIKLIKHIKPSNIRAELLIGTGDPCNTGLLFGALGILIVMWPGKYKLTPDFYNKKLQGNMYAKGRIRACVILHLALKILTNKDIKKMRKQFSKARTN